MNRVGFTALVRLGGSRFAASAACSIVGVCAALLIPATAAATVDAVLGGAGVTGTPGTALAELTSLTGLTGLIVLTVLIAVRALAGVCDDVARVSATTRVAASLRRAFVGQVLAAGLRGRHRYGTEDRVDRLTSGTGSAAAGVPAVMDAAVGLCASAVGLVALSLIDWRLAVAFAAGALPAVLVLRRAVPRGVEEYEGAAAYTAHQSTIAARLGDALAGGRTIRACGTGPVEVARILAPLPRLGEAGMRAWAALRPASWRMDAVATVAQVLVLAVCGWGLVAGRVSAGEFLAAVLYLGFALGLLDNGDLLARLATARAGARRVGDALADVDAPATLRIAGPEHLPPGPGALSLRGIRVRDGDRLVLDRLDLEIPPGASVALVGRPGAGRRTLALLAGGLRNPDQGRVLIDGVAVDAVAPASLRREIAYAFARPGLLGQTVRDALSGGDTAAGARVESAATATGALRFIRRLPLGFDTPLAGRSFSAGERQLMGITRAVAQGGRVLVLDDAVPGVDDVTAAWITDAITVRLAGRTRMIVAHRAATAERADLVVWLDEGRVRAVAPHHTLMLTEPGYPMVFRPLEQP